MKFRLSVIISIFLLVVTPIVVTGIITMENAEHVLQFPHDKYQDADLIAINRLRENIVYIFIIGTVVSITGAGIFAANMADSVNTIKDGLNSLAQGLNGRIPALPGAMGEIATSINEMADTLQTTKDQVIRANRMSALGELAAGVAHEIRNPLTAIKGYTQILEEELPPGDDRLEYTGIVSKEVNRLERLVRGLLDFARPSESRFNLESLQDVVEETLVLVDNGDFRRRIRVGKEYRAKVLAEIDKEQMKQVLLNLLLNAYQAIEGKGEINITLDQIEDTAQIRIRDTGVGIQQGNLDKLYEPFYTTREKGSGLGLSIVHQLLELHGGHIAITSESGKGTTVMVTLPVRQGGEVCD